MDAAHKKIVHATLIVIGVVTTGGCGLNRRYIKRKVVVPRTAQNHETHHIENPPPVTIWVHGTRFIHRPIFHHSFNGITSLKCAKDIDPDYHLYTVAHDLNQADPQQFPLETFYVFGWSGKLRAREREEVAQTLHQEIARICTEYKTRYGVEPVIQIITHSHGGNVVLNLARVAPECPAIDSLILLACPVQAHTMDLVNAPVFKSVYAFFSSLDIVQVIAPQVIYRIVDEQTGKRHASLKIPPFSERYFPECPQLAQVKIKLNGRAIMHAEFVNTPFLSLLPGIMREVNAWKTQEQSARRKLLCVYTSEWRAAHA